MAATNWDQIKEAYAGGASDVEIARLMGLSETEFYQFEQDHAAFATFVNKGRTLAKAWWYEQGRINLRNKEFQTTLYNFGMKNRYGWADKVDTNDTTDKDPVNLDQMRGQLDTALKRLQKKDPELVRSIMQGGSDD